MNEFTHATPEQLEQFRAWFLKDFPRPLGEGQEQFHSAILALPDRTKLAECGEHWPRIVAWLFDRWVDHAYMEQQQNTNAAWTGSPTPDQWLKDLKGNENNE